MKNLTTAVCTVSILFTLMAFAENLVQNPSFEEQTVSWRFDGGTAKAQGVLFNEDAHSGRTCFKITNPSPFGPHVFGSLTQTIEGMKHYDINQDGELTIADVDACIKIHFHHEVE